ncbi:MAG: glycoside hydrolase family 32 protein [Ginsengibacter sp.]
MKKNIFKLLFISCTFLTACNKDHDSVVTPAEVNGAANIYPAPPAKWSGGASPHYTPAGYVGDVMPYYDGDSFHVFYLHDARDGATGFHPWSKFTTKDLTDYTYNGVQIPYGASSDYDLALGTGSIVKVNSTYYAYYSGFNPNFNGNGGKFRDNILLATSSDLTNWQKQASFIIKPETTNGYSQWEFRDPYVFFNDEKNEYWMLVGGQQNGNATVMLYTTKDPATNNWVLQNPAYTISDYKVPETPEMIKWGSFWYLIFSENSVENVTRYRMATSSSGPWTTPVNDKFDGDYMYASKIATDGTNHYLFGWCATKSGSSDMGSRDFGGNLIVHQLTQNSDGSLNVTVPANIDHAFMNEQPLNLVLKQQDVNYNVNNITFPGSGREAFVTYDRIAGDRKITATISNIQAGAVFGILFGMDKAADNTSYYKINFSEGDDIVSGFAVNNSTVSTDGQINFRLEPGKDYQLKIIIDGSVCVVYVDDKVALTSRIYSLNNKLWGFFSNGSVEFKDIKLYNL